MNNLHIEFKIDTGSNVFVDFETQEFIESDIIENIGEIKNEDVFILTSEEKVNCIITEDLEKILLNNEDIKLHSLEYIQWLENKVNEIK